MLSLYYICLLLQVTLIEAFLINDPFLNFSQIQNQITHIAPILPPNDLTDNTRSLPKKLDKVPQYVVDNCPLVHLYSEERYWPSDIKEYVANFHLEDQFKNRVETSHPLSLKDLKFEYDYKLSNGTSTKLNSAEIFMTSDDDFSLDPNWLIGYPPEYGTGLIKKAPAILIIVDKGNGWVDAYWFYFYPFNWGPFIMGYGPWGNHIGDWEHSLVRFYLGEPKYLWMSAHGGGSAYQFSAIEKVKKLKRVDGKVKNEIILRPLIFSARGTHANYASSGQHSHDVPFFFMPLSDFTDRGPMWDPAMNFYGYQYDGKEEIHPLGEREANIGTDWLFFEGRWGDKRLKWNDNRQKWCPVEWKYIDGPQGPLYKNLQRISLCQTAKWWNFWNGCPARKWIKKGEGMDSEKNDLVGDNCGILLYNIRPKFLRAILRVLTWKGVLCFIFDYFTG